MLSAKSHNGKSMPVSVASFLGTGKEELALELISGSAGLEHRIIETAINRPGLALSGFFQYFAHRRIQVVGLAEHEYLRSLSSDEREKRLRAFFEKKIPCVVVTRHKKIFPEIIRLGEEFQTPVLWTKMITKHFINAATIIMENLAAPRMIIQGTMVEIMGIGVLIEGKAGMGKSETALGLIKKGHALVSDDVTALRLDASGSVIGAPVNVTRYHMEIRGLGVIHVPSLFGVASVRSDKKLDFVATLSEPGPRDDEDRSAAGNRTIELLGVNIPRIFVPVAAGRDLANVIETAALDEKLRRLGHDAAKELDEKLVASMSGGKNVSE
jgi:HPr kinase/phosphorylase